MAKTTKILRLGRLWRRAVLLMALCVLAATGGAYGVAQAKDARAVLTQNVAQATRPEQLVAGPAGRIVRVLDGDTVVIVPEGGRVERQKADDLTVRLTGLNAPEIAHENRPAQPFGPEARRILAEWAMGQQVRLYYGGTRKDRYGRALAHLVRADGVWLQEAMLEAGAARMYSFADNRALTVPMLAAEAKARAAGAGLWALPDYQILDAADHMGGDGQFHLVRGGVRDVVMHRQWIFINFGDDWKKDFTATISGRDRTLFDRDMLRGLVGQEVIVRGWLAQHNGPSMALTHPEQIESLK